MERARTIPELNTRAHLVLARHVLPARFADQITQIPMAAVFPHLDLFTLSFKIVEKLQDRLHPAYQQGVQRPRDGDVAQWPRTLPAFQHNVILQRFNLGWKLDRLMITKGKIDPPAAKRRGGEISSTFRIGPRWSHLHRTVVQGYWPRADQHR